jgi:hypothetical protein
LRREHSQQFTKPVEKPPVARRLFATEFAAGTATNAEGSKKLLAVDEECRHATCHAFPPQADKHADRDWLSGMPILHAQKRHGTDGVESQTSAGAAS